MITGVDRYGDAPQRVAHELPVAPHLEIGDASEGRNLDAELSESRGEGIGPLACGLFTVRLAAPVRQVGHLEERRPRARELAHVLPADGQVELRAHRGRQALALGELGARVGVVTLPHATAPLVEEQLRGRHVIARRVCLARRDARRRGRRQRDQQEETRAPHRHVWGSGAGMSPAS